jgi:argininosuccinate lyase
MKLWIKNAISYLKTEMQNLLHGMLWQSRKHLDVVMPGYTHLQRAQPVRWSHWMLSHAWPLFRDLQSLSSLSASVNYLPLGSGAIAGNPFKIDRRLLASDLDFPEVTWNSMDATSDR